MVLSKRLFMVAGKVSPGNSLADIGCDHAYISIYLVRHDICPHAVAMDINEGPLVHARANIERYGCGKTVEVRLSDGLELLSPGECDTILIAGMGGGLMVRILKAGIECMHAADELVLQPQSEIGEVRRFLLREGFAIVDEDMCEEDGKFYTVIHAWNLRLQMGQADSAVRNVVYEKESDYEYGKILLDGQHPVLYDFLKDEYRKALVVKEQLEENDTENTRERMPGFLSEFRVLKEALARMDETEE